MTTLHSVESKIVWAALILFALSAAAWRRLDAVADAKRSVAGRGCAATMLAPAPAVRA